MANSQISSKLECMKRLIYLFFALAFAGSVKAQDLKRVHPVFIEIENKNPDKVVYGDNQVQIKFTTIDAGILKIELTNLTDKNIEFSRKKTYTVVDSKAADTYIDLDRDNAATYQKNDLIPKKTKISTILNVGSFFDSIVAKKYYKEHKGPKHNKLVLAFDIEGKEKEYELDVAIYPKKK